MLDYGFDAGWNDNNEYGVMDDDARCAGFGAPLPLHRSRPLQALLMTRASFEAQARHRPGEVPFSVTRAGCPGIQRYAQTWSGDNTTSWATLRWNIRTGLQMSLSGMFNVGHDVGGFAGPVPDAELFVRWVQACCLNPRMVMNSWKADGTVNVPWLHPDVSPLVNAAIALRYRLLPYLWRLFERARDHGEPIIRPTFYSFPDDEACYADSDDFMVGDEVLVAPVVTPGRHRAPGLPAARAARMDRLRDRGAASRRSDDRRRRAARAPAAVRARRRPPPARRARGAGAYARGSGARGRVRRTALKRDALAPPVPGRGEPPRRVSAQSRYHAGYLVRSTTAAPMPLSPKPRIALLEDDPVQAESLAGWLRAAGFEVAHFRAGYDLMASLRRHPAELLVLDKRVPDISGIEVLKWARADLSYQSPILIITSHDSEVDVVSALEAGADDYLQKPLRRAEFIARIEAAWRRHTGGTVAVTELVLAPYRLDRAEATASLHGRPIELTQKEFDIAWHLFRHVGSLVAREDLLRAVWGLNGSVQTRTLDVHMSRVRRKLALQPENGVRLQSIYSFGYRFDRTTD